MRLAELLVNLSDLAAVAGDPQVDVTQITADSRQVIPGACFVAYQGLGVDGHRFIPDAIARGAAVVVGEHALADLSVAYVRVADGRAALAWLSAAWCGHPSHSMALVGITGTDGKTTTANLLFNILKAASRSVGLISTVHAVIGGQIYNTGLHTTTPDAPDVQRYLAQMREAGTEVAVLETTSHGLAQHRVTGCAFDVAVVTNITHEHLDFHGSYEAYREAKALLFRSLTQAPGASAKSFEWFAAGTGLPHLPKTAVLNRDDSSYEYLARIPAERVITYGSAEPLRGNRGAEEQGSGGAEGVFSATALHLTAVSVRHTPAGTEFDIHFIPCPRVPVSPCYLVTPLIGAFNVSNVLAAVGAALALGIGPAAIAAGVRATTSIPGRMERIAAGQDFTAIVDFAHTPNALARALEAVRPLALPGGRVIVVFGSAGLRDREKRHLMGEVAARLADVAVVTAEDPRTEDLADIMAETAAALAAGGRVEDVDFFCIPDRQRAILHAVRLADPGDVVIICGKGHEQSMCFGVTEHPWRDQDALRWALEARDETAGPPPFELPTWHGD
jgi:UDP-N-acetylmuramoyl-L-alanyl-D-glutamate--2,6-diaminopimelate ligase